MVCECVCEFVCIPRSASKKNPYIIYHCFFLLFSSFLVATPQYLYLWIGCIFVRRFLKLLLLVLHDSTIITYYYPEQDTNYYVTQ